MNKKWDIQTSEKIQDIDDILSLLLTHRGVITEEDRNKFLKPRLEDVTLDSVGIKKKEVEKTLKKLHDLHAKQELIIVYGDYDVDGITGTAILWETLISLGFQTMPYIPHRVDEGYGLSVKGIENLKKQYKEAKLIITVDNGIVASDAVEYAATKGLDVIITDHHQGDKDHGVPNAYAIVHTTNLCGAGVAWLLSKEIQEVFGKVERGENDIHLELAALATIADLVPLTGANRALVFHGLHKLSETKRHGLNELFLVAAVSPKKIGVYEVGHLISPRLNAAGRLESAMDSLRLLCTKDPHRARTLAEQLDLTNKERQTITFNAVTHASQMVRTMTVEKNIIVIAHDQYEEGVIGLVAGRLVEEYHKPAIVISKREKTSKGSVRSISGFNIIEFLRSQSDFFVNVGGHPMAAGFTIETEKIEMLQEKLEKLAQEQISQDLLLRKLKIDMELPFNDISPAYYQAIQSLAPFGMGNPEPVFVSRDVLVREKRIMGKDGKHLRLILQGGDTGKVLEAVAFGMGERAAEIKEEETIDIAYTLDENEWRGNTRLQLKIRDFKTQVR